MTPTPTGAADVYVRDLATGVTSLVSVNAGGTDSGDDVSRFPQFSRNGSKVLFMSNATNLASPVTDGQSNSSHVWLRASATGAVTQVSTGLPGTISSGRLVFSADGTKLAFERRVGTSPVRTDIYVHDRVARTTRLVIVAASGTGGSNNTPSRVHGFDPTNANRLLFSSTASNLVSNDANGAKEDVFIRNLSAGVTRLVSVTSAGTQSGPGRSTQASWLGDGTKVAFVSTGSQFGPTDTNVSPDVYVKDETARTYRLVSLNAAGDDSGNGLSGECQLIPQIGFFVNELSVSSDGARIAFGSDAGDLGADDSDRTDDHDAFVARLVTPPS